VKIPMMPKGVEHDSETAVRWRCVKVKIPMMPKGVEHNRLPTRRFHQLAPGEDSNDAERR